MKAETRKRIEAILDDLEQLRREVYDYDYDYETLWHIFQAQNLLKNIADL